MKLMFISFWLFLQIPGSFCQPTKSDLGNFVGVPPGIKADEMIDPNWQTKTILSGVSWGTFNGIKGNAFFCDDWRDGEILIGGKLIKDLKINFNLYTEQIYFLSDDTVLAVTPTVPVNEFHIWKNAGSELTTFRRGYPAVGHHDANTYFEVVVNGKLSLLKHYEKRIMDATNSVGEHEKKFIDSESWYVFDASNNEMIEVKRNENSILQLLPRYDSEIRSIVADNKLKVRTETGIIFLFQELNRQSR